MGCEKFLAEPAESEPHKKRVQEISDFFQTEVPQLRFRSRLQAVLKHLVSSAELFDDKAVAIVLDSDISNQKFFIVYYQRQAARLP